VRDVVPREFGVNGRNIRDEELGERRGGEFEDGVVAEGDSEGFVAVSGEDDDLWGNGAGVKGGKEEKISRVLSRTRLEKGS